MERYFSGREMNNSSQLDSWQRCPTGYIRDIVVRKESELQRKLISTTFTVVTLSVTTLFALHDYLTLQGHLYTPTNSPAATSQENPTLSDHQRSCNNGQIEPVEPNSL